MAYENYNAINTEIGFLALDRDRVNEEMTGAKKFTDLGEDVIITSDSSEISEKMMIFLKSDM